MTSTLTAAPSSSYRSRQLALGVLCGGMLMIVLDQTIVNVALPSIQRDLGFSQSSLAWVVNAYLIAFGGLLLLAGRLGDLIGRRRVFVTGLTVFTLASVLCGLSGSQEMLIAARFIQGAGGALSSAVILGMIVTMFSEPRDQGKAIGMYSFVASAGASVGLIAGGILTQVLSWHWIFFVNVPVGVVTVLLALKLLESEEGLGLAEGADALGAVLVTAALMLGIYAIVGATDYGWGSPHTYGLGAVAIGLLAAFIARQATARNPLLPLRIFRSRNLSAANAIQGFMMSGMLGMFFMGALYLQRVLNLGPLQIAFAFMPAALVISVLSLNIAPRLNLRFGPRAVLLPSLVIIAVGLALLVRVPVGGQYYADFLPGVVLMGVGVGLAFPGLMTLAMSGVSHEDSGLASGLVNTTAQVSGALGLAVLATISAGKTGQLLVAGQDTPSALTNGYHLAFGIGAVLAAVAAVLAAVALQRDNATEHELTLVTEPTEEAA